MIGFPSFNLFFLLYQKHRKKARSKQAFSKIFLSVFKLTAIPYNA
ncbi:hypothetical protein DHL47_06095 [Streptococcus panodentis]|uniref:Uncharacterized protein n=1 Tax=Streptococcus panodentis TaxID=1581472 RepID=A0ABS5AZ02_9STRE|nr:hypothetical protein [Streptococcus panodentis]